MVSGWEVSHLQLYHNFLYINEPKVRNRKIRGKMGPLSFQSSAKFVIYIRSWKRHRVLKLTKMILKKIKTHSCVSIPSCFLFLQLLGFQFIVFSLLLYMVSVFNKCVTLWYIYYDFVLEKYISLRIKCVKNKSSIFVIKT